MSVDSKKASLHLLGGGVAGVFFHIGALAALDDHLSRKANRMDRFVGTSAGSLMATGMCLGLSPQAIYESVIREDGKMFQINRRDIYRFSMADMSGEFFKALWTLFYITFLKLQGGDAPSYFWGLKEALPAGLFSMRSYEQWVEKFFKDKNLPRFFAEIDKELFIPAFDLDSGRRVVFGEESWKHIPFHKAIAASSAIPIFFKPVQIEDRYYTDGGLGRLAHLDIAAGGDTSLIILLNPMVPVNNDLDSVKIKTVFDEKGRIKDKGFPYVFDQTMRQEWKLRVDQSLQYMGYRYPNIDILLIEPDEDDATMFLFNPMEFDSRRHIAEFAYDLTRRKLKQNSELWKRTLDRHGITLAGV